MRRAQGDDSTLSSVLPWMPPDTQNCHEILGDEGEASGARELFNGWYDPFPSLNISEASKGDATPPVMFDDTDDGTADSATSSWSSCLWNLDSSATDTQRLPELWETLRLAVTTVAVPLGMSTLIRFAVVAPLLGSFLQQNPVTVELTDNQREEVAHQVSKERERLWYEGLVGRAPVLSEAEMTGELQEKARTLEQERRQDNCKAYENFAADFVTAGIIFSGAVSYRERIADLWRSFAFHFTSMQSATQAFILLLLSDVAVGYHSADGWITVCRLLLSHYGLPENEDLISIFVAVVPVSLDVIFKYWVFKWLQSVQPSTKLILSEIDSH